MMRSGRVVLLSFPTLLLVTKANAAAGRLLEHRCPAFFSEPVLWEGSLWDSFGPPFGGDSDQKLEGTLVASG